MKKLLYSIFALVLTSGAISAQDVDVTKATKKAQKALTSYYQDEIGNFDKLMEAKRLINMASMDDVVGKSPDTWLAKAKIFNAISDNQLKAKILNPEASLTDVTSGVAVYDAVKMALSLAQKKNHTNDALKIGAESFGNLNGLAYALFTAGDYANAFSTFKGMNSILDLLKSNDKKLPLENAEDLDNLKYMTGLSALQVNDNEGVRTYFEPLMESGYDEAGIYEGLYKTYKTDSPDKAVMILEKGRAAYPDNVSLLFAEINHYLVLGKMDILVDKLNLAKEKEPNNVSIYVTLGQVYDGMYQKAVEAKNDTEAKKYFDLAFNEYNLATQKDPTFGDAYYSMGALYYNKAVIVNSQLNDLPLSAQKEYAELEAKSKMLFEKALPHFRKSESLNPNDQNTLIALKEIYAITNDFEKSGEFKTRLEKVLAGEKNADSYFNE